MTESLERIILAVIVVTPPTIAAIAAFRKSVEIVKKANEIHYLVDGNLTKVQADLKISLDRSEQLSARVISLEELLKEIGSRRKRDV